MNADLMPSRILPLAGLLQALREVRHLAENGRVEQVPLATAMDSIFRLDADSVADVYGGIHAVGEGLGLVQLYLNGAMPDPQLPKLTLAILQLERAFSREQATQQALREQLQSLAIRARNEGSTHPEILRELGTLYARHLSPLSPKIMVQGNPHYLGRSDVVAEIRALLLAGIRSALLWRQMGGSQWDFLLRRSQMRQACQQLQTLASG